LIFAALQSRYAGRTFAKICRDHDDDTGRIRAIIFPGPFAEAVISSLE